MLVGGGIAFLLSLSQFTTMMGISFTIPAKAGKVIGIIALLGALGIVLTGGRESRNWGMRILKGLYSVYGITSYLSDILSYSRLLALGACHQRHCHRFQQNGQYDWQFPGRCDCFHSGLFDWSYAQFGN
jgi:vacuolar-type H+-ATPase subunit I/STV1